jgi:hypothetical protein
VPLLESTPFLEPEHPGGPDGDNENYRPGVPPEQHEPERCEAAKNDERPQYLYMSIPVCHLEQPKNRFTGCMNAVPPCGGQVLTSVKLAANCSTNNLLAQFPGDWRMSSSMSQWGFAEIREESTG